MLFTTVGTLRILFTVPSKVVLFFQLYGQLHCGEIIVGCHFPPFVEVRLQQLHDDMVGDAFIPRANLVSANVREPIYHMLSLFVHS